MANNTFQIKRTSTAGRTPNTTNSSNSQYINAGELALNMTDGILYTSNGSTLITVGANVVNQQVTGTLTVKAISANGSVGSANQVLTTNGSAVYWANGGGGTSVTISDTAPSSPSAGNLWYYSAAGELYIYYNDADSSQWVTASGGGSINNANNANYANNSSYLGGVAAASYITSFSLSSSLSSYAPLSGASFTGAATFSNTVSITGTTAVKAISANGSVGSANQVLTSNGSSTYWSTPNTSYATTGKAIAMAIVFGG